MSQQAEKIFNIPIQDGTEKYSYTAEQGGLYILFKSGGKRIMLNLVGGDKLIIDPTQNDPYYYIFTVNGDECWRDIYQWTVIFNPINN